MNPIRRKTAVTQIERQAFGGSYFDGVTYNRMFRNYKDFDFGVMSANMFSSELGEHLMNKKFTYNTLAEGKVYYLPSGVTTYSWKLTASPRIDFTFGTLLVGENDQVGKGGQQFEFTLDRGWLHEPVIIKTEGDNLPTIKLIGHPTRLAGSPNLWKYTGVLQTGDPNAWIPAKYLMPGRTAIDLATSVSDELNRKFGGQQFSEMHQLSSHIGRVARKADVTDKMIRLEIGNRKRKAMSTGTGKSEYSISTGYTWQQELRNGAGQKVMADSFISTLETRLEEKVMMDRELQMEFGRTQVTQDVDTGREERVAPGWREYFRDGNVLDHNGDVSLDSITSFIMNIFLSRTTFSNRTIRLATGEAGYTYLHNLLTEEAKAFSTIDTNYIRPTTSDAPVHKHELEFGAQFRRYLAPNGLILELMYDPIKDDNHIFKEMAPGTDRTLESFCYDIFDFGKTDQKPLDSGNSNMCMIREEGAELFYMVSGVYDLYTGGINDGGNAYSDNREAGLRRELDGSLGIWDTSRIGRIQLNSIV